MCALVTFVAPIERASGKVSAPMSDNDVVVFRSPKAGNVLRKFVVPANPQSSAQSVVRGALSAAAQAYKLLDAGKSLAWRQAAATYRLVNQLGASYQISGIDLFVRINLYRQLDGQSIATTPPADLTSPMPAGLLSVSNTGTPNYTTAVAVNSSTVPVTGFICVRWTAPLSGSARQARTSELRFPTSDIADSIIPSTHSSSQSISFAQADVRPDLYLLEDDYVGVELFALNSEYVPSAALFIKNQVVEAAV